MILVSPIRWAALVALLPLVGCQPPDERLPGYVEGDYVRVASPQGGRLQQLSVTEGEQLAAGAPLFRLEAEPERSNLAAAKARLQQSQAQLADLDKGKRRDELKVLQAQLAAASASLELARRDWVRQQKLARQGVVSAATLESYATRVQQESGNREAIAAELRVAQLAAREDQRQAAWLAVQAAQADLDHQSWLLAQKQQQASQAARVEQILYRPGEWVPAGAPVVTLLPPDALKARFYLPEPRRPELNVGSRVTLYCDGCPAPIPARVSYIASEVEFTPPVIYSQENRARLVFLVEAKPEPGAASPLHPGQPLEVSLEPHS